MRIRMPILAAGIVAGALAFGSTSVDANPQIQLNDFFVAGGDAVLVDAPPEAMGLMCYISQGGEIVGGDTLQMGPNLIMVGDAGNGDVLVADGPYLAAIATGTFEDSPWEE